MESSYYIKTNRAFTAIRKYGWIFTLLVAFGGLFYPKLGLLVIPVMIALTTISFFKGRYWCGNFCAHGSLFDSLIMPISRNKKIPKLFRTKITAFLFFGFFMFKLTTKFIRVSTIWGTISFWDKLGFIFVGSYLMVTILGGGFSIFFAPRTWCNICPMGVMQTFSYKLGKLLGITKKTDEKISIASKKMCHKCGKCSRVCPMQLNPHLEFSDNNQFDHEACIRCSTCVVNCPAGILSLDSEVEAISIKDTTNIRGYDERQEIEAKINKINKLAEDINEYVFTFEDPKYVDYKPGQFFVVKIKDDPNMYRAYSIASYNEDSSSLSIIIKRVSDGYGTNIIFDQFKEGDIITLEGPLGNELLVDKNAKKVLFVANGIGITPFIPMAMDVLENNLDQDVTLVCGMRYENEFIYDDYFKNLEYKYDNFKYIKVVSRPSDEKSIKGYVTNIIKEMDLDGYKVYICGSKAMIDSTLKSLDSKGVEEENIFYESA